MMACGTTNTDMYGLFSPKLSVVECGSHSDYIPLVNLLGVYFQIRDDYMNLQSTEVGPHQPTTNLLVPSTPSRLSTSTIKASRKT